MAGKSDYLESKTLRHVYGITAMSVPATVTVHLYTATPSDAGGGTEVTGGSYVPVEVDNDGTTWTEGSGILSNLIDIEFPLATAPWGTAVAFAVKDGSNFLHWGPVSPAKQIDDGDTAVFLGGSPGELVITED